MGAQSALPTYLAQVQDEAVPCVETVPAQHPLSGTNVLLALHLVEFLDGSWGGSWGGLVKRRLHAAFLQPGWPAGVGPPPSPPTSTPCPLPLGRKESRQAGTGWEEAPALSGLAPFAGS